LNWFTAMVPVMNISLAIKELLKGTMNYLILAGILGSTFLIAGALLAFTTWWFGREAVLFRE
jgi:sodium transport system permease protein